MTALRLDPELSDAERYRMLRRIILRQAPARDGAIATYGLELDTLGEIDPNEFDRIVDYARLQDDGHRAEFGLGRLPAREHPAVGAPRLQLLRVLEFPKAPPVPPVVCACGAVRPRTRGRRPAVWTCEACLG